MQAHNTVTLPYRRSHNEVSYLVKLQVLKRFGFTSQSMKSGAIAVPQDDPDSRAILFVKGAPGVIKHLADPATVPDNFFQVASCSSSQALCHPVLFAAGFFIPAHALSVSPNASALDLDSLDSSVLVRSVLLQILLCCTVLAVLLP